ncbi:MAG: TauD/TfdA family dioxygenase [Acidimicrobiales bacterium]|jgi:taurine dioxygenase|nr:TauD/TfdA family dioxygenase [Acidimicrobiales bacterium]
MALDVTPSGRTLGATARGVDLRDLDDAAVAEIRVAWLEHKVLAFPDQPLTEDDLEAFTLRFGPFGHDPFFESIDTHSHIAAIARAADETAPVFAESWHTDWSFQVHPPDGTCLFARIVPPVGGDTLYLNQQAALEAMPADLRARIDGKIAIHSARTAYSPDGMYGDSDADEVRAMRIVISDEAYDTHNHPLVRIHAETGAETLYSTLGYIIGIEGMDDDDAVALLTDVYGWQTRDEFQYRHHWEPNMLVMWDNRVVLHKATGGYDGHERLLHRTTIGYNAAMAVH